MRAILYQVVAWMVHGLLLDNHEVRSVTPQCNTSRWRVSYMHPGILRQRGCIDRGYSGSSGPWWSGFDGGTLGEKVSHREPRRGKYKKCYRHAEKVMYCPVFCPASCMQHAQTHDHIANMAALAQVLDSTEDAAHIHLDKCGRASAVCGQGP